MLWGKSWTENGTSFFESFLKNLLHSERDWISQQTNTREWISTWISIYMIRVPMLGMRCEISTSRKKWPGTGSFAIGYHRFFPEGPQPTLAQVYNGCMHIFDGPYCMNMQPVFFCWIKGWGALHRVLLVKQCCSFKY